MTRTRQTQGVIDCEGLIMRALSCAAALLGGACWVVRYFTDIEGLYWAGLVLLAITALLGAARVVAHVHHVQDVVAGAALGLVAALAGILTWRAVRGSSPARRAVGQGGVTASRPVERRP